MGIIFSCMLRPRRITWFPVCIKRDPTVTTGIGLLIICDWTATGSPLLMKIDDAARHAAEGSLAAGGDEPAAVSRRQLTPHSPTPTRVLPVHGAADQKTRSSGQESACETAAREENRRRPPRLTMNCNPNGKSRLSVPCQTSSIPNADSRTGRPGYGGRKSNFLAEMRAPYNKMFTAFVLTFVVFNPEAILADVLSSSSAYDALYFGAYGVVRATLASDDVLIGVIEVKPRLASARRQNAHRKGHCRREGVIIWQGRCHTEKNSV